MAEDKYTWDDLICNPTLDSVKDAVGKKVYYSDKPSRCLNYANEQNDMFCGILKCVFINREGYFCIDGRVPFYDCIIVKKEDQYSEREKKWIEENDLKVGDYVKPLREAKSHENGWNAEWVSAMDDYVGKTLKVMSISPIDSSIILECNYAAYSFPYFVLEKVEPPKPKYVPFESKEEFLLEYYEKDRNLYLNDPDKIEQALSENGMWLRWKGEYVAVTHISDNGINENTDIEADWQDLVDNYTFLNGTPCGKEVKE